jgi:hypothetical protein
LFGGNGGLPRSIIGDPKYPKGLRGLGGLNPPFPRFDGCLTKNCVHLYGHFYMHTNKFYSQGLDFIPTIV